MRVEAGRGRASSTRLCPAREEGLGRVGRDFSRVCAGCEFLQCPESCGMERGRKKNTHQEGVQLKRPFGEVSLLHVS